LSLQLKPEHVDVARASVAKAHALDGLAPLDLDAFWAVNRRALRDPFGDDCPQVPLGIHMANECVFAELGVEPDFHRLIHDADYRLDLHRRYNDRAEQIVGRRLLPEQAPGQALPPLGMRGLNDLFESENRWMNESYWLMQSAHDPGELRALLDRVEKRLEDPRRFFLPPDWPARKAGFLAAGGKLPLYRYQRGPVTFATSVYGVENLVLLIYDNPDLAGRFRDLLLRSVLERACLLDEEAGFTPETAPRGFSWADDNCAVLTPEMYAFFGQPILEAVFRRYAPEPGDRRFQHSDSDMGHLLPVLAPLRFTAVNFGPRVMVSEIREHMPGTVIQGQLAPFTFSRNEEVNMVAEFLRDYEMAREKRGLVFTTAGSVNNGSRLTGLRLIMAAIQTHGRYG
jgi:uroporphyrinogen decarboxylase